MKAKIFISDEGYGPIVRQSAIISELEKLFPDLRFDIQTEKHIEAVEAIVPQAFPIKKFNNIRWDKTDLGSPDLNKIKDFLSGYKSLSEDFIKTEKIANYDFVISDFVYEAFTLYNIRNIPVYGIAHFTWDWFFAKLFPPVITDLKLIDNWIKQASGAKKIFFPPFTPKEILNCYKELAIEVPLIVRKSKKLPIEIVSNKPKILIMDSGSKVNGHNMELIYKQLPSLDGFLFFLQEDVNLPIVENVFPIKQNQLMSDLIPNMDLVIGRAGFNTISECIANRVPMLLFSEHMNPEMNENILNMNEIGFGSFINMKKLTIDLKTALMRFFDFEIRGLKYNLDNHEIGIDGAEVIANYIADDVYNNMKQNQ